MMAWPEDQQAEWAGEPMLDTAFYPPGATSEHAQHGGNLFASLAAGGSGPQASASASQTQGLAASGMTYSASCPSFSGMYDDELLRDLQGGAPGDDAVMAPAPSDLQSFGLAAGAGSHPFAGAPQEPLMDAMPPSEGMGGPAGYDYLMQFQQEYQDASQRQFPHQQSLHGGADDMRQQMAMLSQQQQQQQQPMGPRRGFHGSQSFTSLSSMENDYRRLQASKRKKGGESWMKLQRHKSFDSSTPGVATAMSSSAPASSDYPTSGSTFSSATATPETHFLQEPPDSDMIGFSIDDLSSTPTTSETSWPMDVYGSAPGSSSNSGSMASFMQQQQQQPSVKPTTGPSASEAASELDLLLSENERANLFDAIRDFESPGGAGGDSSSAPEPAVAPPSKPKDKVPKKKTTHSPPLHPGRHRRSGTPPRSFSLSSSPPTGAAMPPAGPSSVPMRTRLQQILVRSVQNSDAGASLSSFERNYLMSSPMFQAAKAPETAGSLWLLLHSAQCESGCEIAGCSVMRRVLTHCLGCELLVGKCKQPCNDAKAMLLHYGSCNSKGSMHGRSCAVCWNLLEIDHSHQALNNGNNGNNSVHGRGSRSPSPRMGTPPPLMPMPSSPALSSSPSFRSPTLRPAPSGGGSSGSKHVPIQPNPLPTASNPMGLMGALPPHFGYSLSLYLEQTSAPFRAEVKARVEKRVTAAAGQDLLQHMQKKTRLRSLDDLRSEARTVVLGEMERELHFHMQAYSWAQAGDMGSVDGAVLPPYLMSVAAAGFGAFQAAAVQPGAAKPPSAPSASPPTAPRRARSASASAARSAASGSPPKVPVHNK